MLHPLTGQSPSNDIILNLDIKTSYTSSMNYKEKPILSFNSPDLPAQRGGVVSGMTDTESLSAFVNPYSSQSIGSIG